MLNAFGATPSRGISRYSEKFFVAGATFTIRFDAGVHGGKWRIPGTVRNQEKR